MKLFDATLDLARFAKGTEDYKITKFDYTQNMFECNVLAGRVAEFGEGSTVWFRTGDCAGMMARVQSGLNQQIRLQTFLPAQFHIGDEVTICSMIEFDTQKLINAVNSVLRTYKILKMNDELRYATDQRYYDLPEGVTDDVRRVVLMDGRENQQVSHYWRTGNGMLDLYSAYGTAMNDSPIRLYYVDYHGEVGPEDEISDQVDPLYLRYMSWLYLCRNLLQGTHKDNLIATDMYNEAKIYERDYSKKPNPAIFMKSWSYPVW